MKAMLLIVLITVGCSSKQINIPVTDADLMATQGSTEFEYKAMEIPIGYRKPPPLSQPLPVLEYRGADSIFVTDEFLEALIMAESSGSDSALGDYRNGKAMAYGCLQVWDLYVRDANRISGTTFSHEDMFNRDSAKTVVRAYLTYYGKRYTRITGESPSYEVLARIHNGGPNGWKNPRTDTLWGLVQKHLQ